MKKLTLFLIAACFAVSLQAQMLGEANQVKAFKEFKMANYNAKITRSADDTKIAATSNETDTLHPQCMYFACADDGKLYSYVFGTNPAEGAVDEGNWNQILGGTNSRFNFSQSYFPAFYGGSKEGYYFGADRVISGVIVWAVRSKSPIRSMEVVPSFMELYTINYQDFLEVDKENQGEVLTNIPVPDKFQCASQNIDIQCDVDMPDYKEKGYHQNLVYEFPCNYNTPSDRAFAIRWNLPLDSTLMVASFTFKAGCIGEEENASSIYTSKDTYYQFADGSGIYLPENNPQRENDSIFAPSSLIFGEKFEFYWRPVVNTSTANDNIESIDFKASVYPIPASSELTISSLYKMSDIKIYNTAGQLIKTAKANDNIEFVDISSLTDGVYVAKINTEKGLITKKIIVKK